MKFGMQSLSDSFDVNGNIMNGYLMAFIILQTLLVHVPLLIALVAGDMISGEANQGTLRLLLTKPVSRAYLITGKFIASSIYTIVLLLWMAVWALAISIMIFGADDMLILKSDMVTQILASDVMWRYVAAFGFASLAMLTVSALSFFLSLFAENSIGPIMATMSIILRASPPRSAAKCISSSWLSLLCSTATKAPPRTIPNRSATPPYGSPCAARDGARRVSCSTTRTSQGRRRHAPRESGRTRRPA
jgi:hypothetical protein